MAHKRKPSYILPISSDSTTDTPATEGWFEVIHKLLPKGHEITIYHNVRCLKCNQLFDILWHVGNLFFCEPCYREEFKTENPVTQEREVYLQWLKKDQERQ